MSWLEMRFLSSILFPPVFACDGWITCSHFLQSWRCALSHSSSTLIINSLLAPPWLLYLFLLSLIIQLVKVSWFESFKLSSLSFCPFWFVRHNYYPEIEPTPSSKNYVHIQLICLGFFFYIDCKAFTVNDANMQSLVIKKHYLVNRSGCVETWYK